MHEAIITVDVSLTGGSVFYPTICSGLLAASRRSNRKTRTEKYTTFSCVCYYFLFLRLLFAWTARIDCPMKILQAYSSTCYLCSWLQSTIDRAERLANQCVCACVRAHRSRSLAVTIRPFQAIDGADTGEGPAGVTLPTLDSDEQELDHLLYHGTKVTRTKSIKKPRTPRRDFL